ncbi:DNA-binding response regulator [Colwellia psychrerythraea]|uniref:DNA-binding response regulator n=1 Tax=Colwellia psychrerythraea TaxID=28229 RepID=A0A1Y5EUN0_COLPS|nr:DNA-binding response regulator [Colwellia psychrerythraea]
MSNLTQPPILVQIVDDHPMVQGGLKACLSFYDDIVIVGSTDDGSDALNKAIELKPDVILMDISMPTMNGIDATEIITEQLPETKVLILSMHSNPEFVKSAIQAGAVGYLLKDTTSEEIYYAIKAVANGKTHFSSSIAKLLLDNPVNTNESEKLTTREQVVLSYLAKGKTSKEIAKILNISFRTVEAHRRNMKTKLGIHSLAKLISYAVKHGIIKN